MRKRKILLLCLSLCLICADFITGEAGVIANTLSFIQSLSAAPSDGVVYETDFDTLDNHIVKYSGQSELLASDSALVIEREEGAYINLAQEARIYANADKSAVELPKTAIEFRIKRSQAQKAALNFCDENGQSLTQIKFQNSDNVSFKYGDQEQVKEEILITDAAVGEYIDVKLHINHITKKLDVWFGGNTVLQEKSLACEGGNFAFMSISMIGENCHSVYLDSFKVYEAEESDYDKVYMDYEWLDWKNISNEPTDAVTSDINIDSTGKYGSTLTWSVSGEDTSVLTTEGKVNRSIQGDKTVTLTVLIECGTAEPRTRTYTVTVKQLTDAALPTALDGEYIVNDSLKGNTLPANVYAIGGKPTPTQDGVRLSEGDTLMFLHSLAQDAYSVPLAYEMKLSADGTKIDFYDTTDMLCYSVKTQDNAIYLLSRDNALSEPEWQLVKNGLTGAKLVVAIDPMTSSMSLWYGEDRLATAVLGAANVKKLYKVTLEQNEGECIVSDFKSYKAQLSSKDSVAFDKVYVREDTVTWQNKDNIIESIELPEKGHTGSTITWTTSNEAVMTHSGEILQAGRVTLTALIENEGVTDTRELSFTVNPCAEVELPHVGKIVYSETFDGNEYKEKDWEFREQDGRITAREEKLIVERHQNESLDSNTQANLNFAPSNQPLQGLYAMEFTLRHTPGGGTRIRIGKETDYFGANWYDDGTMKVYNRETPTSETRTTTLEGISGVFDAKFTILFNTADERFSLWVNNKLVLKNVYSRFVNTGGLRYIYVESKSQPAMEIQLDNLRIYETLELSDDKVRLDKEALVLSKITANGDVAAEYGCVSQNLVLPSKGVNGSDITWESLSPGVVVDGNTGVLIKGDDYQTAVLQATITAGEGDYIVTDTKEIEITISPNVNSAQEVVARDAQMLNYESIVFGNGDGNTCVDGKYYVIRSLNFSAKGALGSSIRWSSSDTAHITKAGRVIRPRFDEEDAEVTVTATVSYEGASPVTKEFSFTVLADEPFVDPQDMSDEEFFGVYSGGKWTTEGKLDYTYKGLEKVGEAAKAGNYALAKEELLYYAQNVRESRSTVSSADRDVKWANALIDDWRFMGNGTKYAQADMYITDEWKEQAATLRGNIITPGGSASWSIRAWYNEASYAEIARTTSSDPKMRPRIEITLASGEVKTFYATDDVGLRAGQYRKSNFDHEEYLIAQDFGDFESDNLRQGVLKFKFDDLKPTDEMVSARLVLYARAMPQGCESKRLFIAHEPSTTWSGDTAVYDTFKGNIYSFEGQPDEQDSWMQVETGEVEYFFQSPRLKGWPKIAVEYQITGNEEYAYKSMRVLGDMFTETKGWRSKTGGNQYDETGLRGGWPRSLDSGVRAQYLSECMDVLLQSRYVTSEFITAYYKHMWDMANYALHYHNKLNMNHEQYQLEGLLDLSEVYPEFTDALSGNNWYMEAMTGLRGNLLESTFPDGSSFEASDGYSLGTFSGFVQFKKDVMAAGGSVSPEFDERLHKFAYYQALLYGPDGLNTGFGDSTPGGYRSYSTFADVVRWYGDEELEFIASNGTRGKEPSYTSRTFPDSSFTTMRASWDPKSPFLLTNVRGGAQHDHSHYNAIWLNAYGNILLSDMGIFAYDINDPYRQWGLSTRAHNTVLINDVGQLRITGGDSAQTTGIVHEFDTNKAFDYISQTVPEVNTPGFTHRRTISFIKPNLFIVSDLMTPTDKTKINNYKQLWHMLPEAKLDTNEADRTVFSNYATGGNIIIASADEDVQTVQETGWYDLSKNMIEEVQFAYFEKEYSMGDTTFDSVLMPNDADETAKVAAQKLDSEDGATALKIDFTERNVSYTGYYHMDYEGIGGVFGPYRTDAQTAYVQEKADGSIAAILIKDGTFIERADGGATLIRLPSKTEGMYVDMTATYISVTGEDSDIQSAVIAAPAGYNSKLFANESEAGYEITEGFIRNIGSAALKPPTTGEIKNPITGIENVGGDNSGGGGGGGGGASGSDTEDPEKEPDTQPDTDITDKSFPDVNNHWAEEYVSDLLSKGIVNGDENGNFNPDNSIKRSEFIAIAVRSAGFEISEYKGSFEDVSKDDWYASVIQTALDNGIISEDTHFRPDDLITREEMAKIICGIAQLEKLYDKEVVLKDTYTDADSISAWAKQYVKYISASGLMKGREDGNFAPRDGATRAEAAAVISRWLKMEKE